MPIFVYGLNHSTAELDLRGRATFATDEIDLELRRLHAAIPSLHEVVILSTCNRVELHLNLDAETPAAVSDWLVNSRDLTTTELKRVAYVYEDADAVAHIMRVASGLDSQILGESQILGQLKDAYRMAKDADTIGTRLNLIEEFTLRTAKRIRSETPIGEKPVSVAYATLTMAKQIFADFSSMRILLIGAGSNIRLIAQYLKSANAKFLTFANRTLRNARILAHELDGDAIKLEDFPPLLRDFDIVISSTGSSTPIVTRAMVEDATQVRKHRPMFIADLSVPRDVEAIVNELNDVYLYTVDDLSAIVEENFKQRRAVLDKAEALVLEGVECYQQQLQIQLGASLMSDYREQVEQLRKVAVEKAFSQLNNGATAATVIEKLAHELSNQLAHKPTISLRRATALRNEELLVLLKDIYELEN